MHCKERNGLRHGMYVYACKRYKICFHRGGGLHAIACGVTVMHLHHRAWSKYGSSSSFTTEGGGGGGCAPGETYMKAVARGTD